VSAPSISFGFSRDEVWERFVERISLCEECAKKVHTLSVGKRFKRQEDILKLEKLIERTEAAAWTEQQPKK